MGQYGPENELLVLDKQSLKLDTITHYTSIPTLFKILRNQNILFNRIDNVNDLTEKEGLVKHENYRRLFVSCFSIRKSESIPMWRMYTKKDTGIMLQFKFRQGYQAEEFFVRDFIKSSDGSMYNIIPNDKRGEVRVQLDAVEVTYTNKPKHYPTMNVIEENKEYDVPDHFGIEKSKAWSYEKEIRFRAILRGNFGCEKIPDVPYLFPKITYNAIDELTIVFNPWISKDDWGDIIQDFIDKQHKLVKTFFLEHISYCLFLTTRECHINGAAQLNRIGIVFVCCRKKEQRLSIIKRTDYAAVL